MKRRFMVAGAVLLVVAMVALTGSAATAKPGKERPFKGRWSGTFELVADGDWCEGDAVPVRMVAERGRATLVGRWTAEARHCADFETGTFFDGVLVIVAANGDELHATYSGQFLPPLPDGTQRVASTHVYDGGTGRFVNASGTADAPAWFNFTTETEGTIRGKLNGTLSFKASDRRN